MTVRNAFVFIGALIAGALLNMLIVQLGTSIIPPPPGVDTSTPEGLAKSMHLFQEKHFIAPWLAHALGTLAGAFIVSRWSTKRNLFRAMLIGVMFFIGGVYMIYQIPATPRWFVITDLAGAYFPMAWLGARLGRS